MTTLVWGHGTRDKGDEKTFVPDGATVKFYSDVDENLFTRNGFVAVSSGEFGDPNESVGPGSGTTVEIFNYGVMADLGKADFIALLNREGNNLMFVGKEVAEGHFCNDVTGCKTAGSHKCDGVFGKVDDKEIVILVCRGLAAMQYAGLAQATLGYGTNQEAALYAINQDTSDFINGFCSRIGADAAAAEKEFDELSDPVKIILTTDMRVTGWSAVRWAADFGKKGSIADLFTQIKDDLDNANAAAAVALPAYAEGFAAAAEADAAEFFKELDGRSGQVIEAIKKLADVASARPTA